MLGLHWHRATVAIKETTGANFNASIRVGYTDMDTTVSLGISMPGLSSTPSLLGVIESESSHTLTSIGISNTGSKGETVKIKVVNAWMASIPGYIFIKFSGASTPEAILSIIESTAGNFPCGMTILSTVWSPGDPLSGVYIHPVNMSIYVTDSVNITSALGIYIGTSLDVTSSLDIPVSTGLSAPSNIFVVQQTADNTLSLIKIVNGIASTDVIANINVVISSRLSSLFDSSLKINASSYLNFPINMEIDKKLGYDIITSLGVQKQHGKSFGCSLFVTDYGKAGPPRWRSIGDSGGDVGTAAGIPPRPYRPRAQVPVSLKRYGLSALPSWLDMVKYSTSIGNQFFDSINMELQTLDDEVIHTADKYFIETCKPKVDVVGYCQLPDKDIAKITVSAFEKDDGGRYRWMLQEAASTYKFYHADKYYNVGEFVPPDGTDYDSDIFDQTHLPTFDTYYIDRELGIIIFRFSNGRYNSAIINGKITEIAWRQVWNELDDLSAILSLERLKWESNAMFKSRIMDVFNNIEYQYEDTRSGEPTIVQRNKAPDVTFIGLSVAIARELGLVTTDNDGHFLVKIKSLSDENFRIEELYDEDMVPNDKFESLVKTINAMAPVAWGEAKWDTGRWFTNSEAQNWPSIKLIWDILKLNGEL